MRVLVVSSMQPFVWGGAEELARHLQKHLILAGHDAEVLRIPFQPDPATRIPSQMLMVRTLELGDVDHVIALKFPSYLIRHPVKTLWLLHQFRQVYDLRDTEHSNLPAGRRGQRLRSLVVNADGAAFSESRRIFVLSNTTRKRLLRYNGVSAEVLLHPVNDPELFVGGHGEAYIFAGGRVNDMKRQLLLLEALSKARSDVKLLVAGPPDHPGYEDRLQRAVERLDLGDRVTLDLRFLPREAYAEYVNRSAAVAYIPFDEDSLGYVAMEAATAGKPIITATDSGGVLGLVRHGETGWVCEPHASSLADAMDSVRRSPKQAQTFGMAARELWESLGASWPRAVETLLS